MRYRSDRHHRRSMRWRGYDYASFGAYFVTICTQGSLCLFGEVVGGEMRVNAAGEMVWHWWRELAIKWPCVEPSDAVVMPNHVHGIVVLHPAPVDAVKDGHSQNAVRCVGPAPTPTLPVGAHPRVIYSNKFGLPLRR